MQVQTPKELAALVRESRRAAKLSQQGLAALIGASRQWVQNLEAGKPGVELGLALRALAALGVTLDARPAGAHAGAVALAAGNAFLRRLRRTASPTLGATAQTPRAVSGASGVAAPAANPGLGARSRPPQSKVVGSTEHVGAATERRGAPTKGRTAGPAKAAVRGKQTKPGAAAAASVAGAPTARTVSTTRAPAAPAGRPAPGTASHTSAGLASRAASAPRASLDVPDINVLFTRRSPRT